MNAFENWFCASPVWRYVTRRKLLPWLLQGSNLGEHLLELGAGPGAATPELRQRAARVTSLDYDHKFAAALGAHENGAADKSRLQPGNGVSSNVCCVLQGDASFLPFASGTFTSAIAILMLHHLRSAELQDRAFAEIFRVLRPGGVFLAFEIQDGWLHRVGHTRSTFVPVAPASAFVRLEAAGFSRVMVDFRRGGFRIKALRSWES
jgi:SAM-dependent methyltransferase